MHIVPDLDNGRFVVTPHIKNAGRGLTFRAVLLDGEKELAEARATAVNGVPIALPVEDPLPWSPDDPHLYDLVFELESNKESLDRVGSHAGLRKFHIEGNRFFLNNEPIFLRFVLDQGFYMDGIWTAPSDQEFKADIERSMDVGFNGARLHQKVFEERFHHWADRLGYLTWGEFCDWGIDFGKNEAVNNHQKEWREIVVQRRNHPSLVAWTPFNETRRPAQKHEEIHRQALKEVYGLTKALDPTRPVNDTSGYVHVLTDIFTVHDYEQDPEKFREHYENLDPSTPGEAFVRFPEVSAPYQGQPYMVDEYGGTWWVEGTLGGGSDREESWGYGGRPSDIEEALRRIEKLTHVLTSHPHIAGFTYTQLTDIEQEQNGIYTYDRRLKFNPERLRRAFGAPATIEGS